MKAAEARVVREVQFLRDQDGPSERLLKNRLTALFSAIKSVNEAYLCVIKNADLNAESIALCLHSEAVDRKNIVDSVGYEFSNLFKTSEFLDIIFISELQKQEIAVTCKAFYPATG